MQERHDGHDAHLVFEADGNVDDDEHDGHQERDERRLDDRGAPVRPDGGHLEAVRGKAQVVGHLVRSRCGFFCARRGRAHQEALFAARVSRLDDGVRLARLVESGAHLLGSHALRPMERHGRAAHELDAEVQAPHSHHYERGGNEHGRHAQEHAPVPQEVDVVLDELAPHMPRALRSLFAGLPVLRLGHPLALDGIHGQAHFGLGRGGPFGRGKRLVVLGRLKAVAHAPEGGVLGDGARGEQADEGRLEQQHHDDVAHDAERKRQAETLHGGRRQEEQRERAHKRHQVGVDRRHDGVLDARDGRGPHAAAHAYLLPEALHGEDGRVRRHADGEHDARDAGERKAEQPERRKRRQDAQVQHGEHRHGSSRDQAQALIEHQQVEHDHRKADAGHHDAGSQRVLAKRGTHHLALRVFEAHGQRAAFQHGLQRLRLFERVVARDGDVAVQDLRLHGGGELHLVVQDDDDLALRGHQVGGGLGERRRPFRIQPHVHGVVGRRVLGLADGDVRDVLAGDQRRVGALGHFEMDGLARRELVAELVGDGALFTELAVLDLALHLFVGERVEPRERELAGLADGLERLLGVGQTGDLHKDLVRALHLHDRLGRTEGVDAAFDDGAAFLHVLGRHGRAVLALRSEHHRKATLDVEALVDPLRRRGEKKHRADDEQRGEDEQPQVAAVGRAIGLFLLLRGSSHGRNLLLLGASGASPAPCVARSREPSYCATNVRLAKAHAQTFLFLGKEGLRMARAYRKPTTRPTATIPMAMARVWANPSA